MSENKLPEIDWTQAGSGVTIEPADYVDSTAEEDKKKKNESTDLPQRKTPPTEEKSDTLPTKETPEIDWSTYSQANENPYLYEPISVQVGDIGLGDSKWDSKRPITLEGSMDLNERRAERQSKADKWMNGAIKMVGKTGTNVAGGIVGTIYGAGSAILNADVSKIWDNSIMHGLDDMNEWMDETLPNYYTKYEREMSLWERLGSANFWADQFTNGMSFIAGAALTEVALTAASGFSLGAALPAQAAWTAAQLAKAKKIFGGMKGVQALTKTAAASKINAYMKGAVNSKRMWQSARIGRQLLTGAGFEASVEARHSYEHMTDSLTKAWKMQIEQQEGVARDLTDAEKLEIDKIAKGNANVIFAGNLALVGISNMVMLGKLYGPGASLKMRQQNIMRSLGLGAPVKTADGTAKAAYKTSRIGEALGMSEKAIEKMNKGIAKVKAVGLPAVYEGFVEEGGQSMLNIGGYEYAMLKHGIYGKKQTAEFLDVFNRSFIQTYGDPDGQSEVALGFILGILGMPGTMFNNGAYTAAGARLNEVNTRHSFQDYAADYYNKHGKDLLTSFKSYANFMTEQQELAGLMDKAIAEGNIAEYKNLQNDLFFSYVKAKLMTGMFDDIAVEADMIREMSDPEFIEYMGYDANDFTDASEIAARKNKMADSIIEKAKRIKKAYDKIDEIMELDSTDKWTNEQISTYREKMAHRLASLDLMDERFDKMLDKLAEMTGGIVNENTDTEGFKEARTITYKDAEGKEHTFTVGGFTASSLKHYYKRLLEVTKSPEGKLNVPSQFKDEAEYREFLNQEIERVRTILNTEYAGTVQADTLTEEELQLLSVFADQLEQWRKEDPVNGVKKEKEIIQLLKDMRHIRARKQEFIKQLNALIEGKDKALENTWQDIERFVDDVNSEEGLSGILDPEAKALFNKYGPHAKFRVGDVWYRFNEHGDLLVDGDPNTYVDSKILRGLPLDNIVTDRQEEAKKMLDAIDALKGDKAQQIEDLNKQIQEVEEELLKLMIEIEEEGLDDQIKTGRKKGKFISVEQVREVHKKLISQIETGEKLILELEADKQGILNQIDKLTELAILHYNSRTKEFDVDPDQRYEAENIMMELEAIKLGIPVENEDRYRRITEIQDRLTLLAQQEQLLLQQQQVEEDTAVDNTIITNKLNAISLEAQDLIKELELIQNSPKNMTTEDRQAAVEIASEIRDSVNEWVNKANENISIIQEKLAELRTHRDIIEKTLLDRIKQLKGFSVLDGYSATNLDEFYAEQVSEFEAYVRQVESEEQAKRVKGESEPEGGWLGPRLRRELNMIMGDPSQKNMMQGARIKGVPAEVLELELDQSKGLKTYSEFKNFRKNNPTGFEYFLHFANKIDKVEKLLDDIRILRQDLKATNTEVQEFKNILNELRNQRQEGDVDNILNSTNNLIKAAEFLDQYDEILAKLLDLENVVIKPIIHDQNTEEDKNKEKTHSNPITSNVTVQEIIQQNQDLLFRPDISYPGYYKTAGSLVETDKILKELSQTDGQGEYILDDLGLPQMREGLDQLQQNAWKAYVAQKVWFQATSKYLNYTQKKKNGKNVGSKPYKLMVVHSNNIPPGMENDLRGTFWNGELDDGLSKMRDSGKKGGYSDSSTNDYRTTDIKIVIVDSSGRPLRVNAEGNPVKTGGMLVHSSIMLPNYTNADGTVRFTNEQNLPDSTLQSLQQEYLQDRKRFFDSSDNLLLDINGFSVGVPNTENKLHPILGRVISTHKNAKKAKDVVVGIVTKELVDGKGNKYGSVEVGGMTFNVPRTGMAYTVVNGNLVPLHTRNLNIHEATNIINLLRWHRASYNALRALPENKNKAKSELLTESAKLTVESGKQVHVYSEVISSITRFGSGTQGLVDGNGGSVQFYDDPKRGGIVFGDNFISYEQLQKNDATKIAQLTSFLQNKYHQVNKFKLKNTTKKASTAPFYVPVLKEVGENNFEIDTAYKMKYSNYEEYLLEKRDNSDLAPPLQTNIVPRSGGLMAPQYKYRYIKYSIPGKNTKKVRRKTVSDEEIQVPEGVVYSQEQTEDIKAWESKINGAKKGQRISIEIIDGFEMPIEGSGYAEALDQKLGVFAMGSNAGPIPSDNDYLKLIGSWMDEYKSSGYNIGFEEFVSYKQNVVYGDNAQKEKAQTALDNALFGEDTSQEQKDSQEDQTADTKEDGDEAPVQNLNDLIIIGPSPAPQPKDEETEEDKQKDIDKTIENDNLTDDLFDDEVNMILDQADEYNLKKAQNTETTEELALEILNAQQMLPQQTVTIVSGFIKGNNPQIVAQMRGFGNTFVSTLAPGGAVYHETFHNVSYYLLPKETRDNLYNEVKNQKGSVKTYKGKTKLFSTLTDKEAEEYLAEEFRKWILSDGTYKGSLYSSKEKGKPKGFWAQVFDTIKNFLRGFFGLDNKLQVDPQMQETADLFNKIKTGHFANKTPLGQQDTVANMALLTREGIPTSARFSMDVMQMLTRHLGDVIFDDSALKLTIQDLENLANPYQVKEVNVKLKKAYQAAIIKALRELQDRLKVYRDNGEIELMNQTYDSIRYLNERGAGGTMANFKSILDTHRQFLVSIGLNLKPEMGSVLSETNRSKDKFGIMDSYQFSAVSNAHPYIKILLGSLPNSQINTTGTPGTIDANYAMNFIQSRLAGITNPAKQLAKLQELSVKHDWIKILLRRLGTFESNSSFNDMRKHTMFWQQMGKTQNNFISYLIDSDGSFYSLDANNAQLNDIITNRWKNKLKNSKTIDSTGNRLITIAEGKLKVNMSYKMNLPSINLKNMSIYNAIRNRSVLTSITSNPKASLELFELLGMEFSNREAMLKSDEEIEGKSVPEILTSTASWLLKELANSPDTGADLFDRNNINIKSRLGLLLKAEMLFNEEVVELRHLNAEGKPVYGITLNTYVSLIANKLNQRDNVPHLNSSKNRYTANSIVKKEMEDNPDSKITIHVIEGARIDKAGDKGLHTSKLTYADRTAIYLNSVLKGISPILRTADSKTEYGVQFPVEQFSNIIQARDILLGYFTDELTTATHYRKTGVGSDIQNYRDEANDLRIFNHIVRFRLNKAQNKDLDSTLNSKMSIEEFMKKHSDAVFGAINGYLIDQMSENIKIFTKNNLIKRDKGGLYKNYAIDPQTLVKILDGNITNTKNLSSDQLSKVAEIFTLNNFIHNIEQLKLFFGDPAFFKDFYKRTKLAVGTKKYARTDAVMNSWLNENTVEVSSELSEKYGIKDKDYNGTATIYVSQDPLSESAYADEYAIWLDELYPGKSEMYRQNMISDGMGYSTIHFYREVLMRTGDWTAAQERMFTKMMKGEKLSVKEMALFPPLKPQQFGPALSDKGLTTTVGIKFALMPIFPQMTVIKGKDTALGSMLKNMYDTGTDMVMHPSAMKVGNRVDSKTGFAPVHYANDGSIALIDPKLHTTIDLSFFGIQVDATKDIKNKVTVGTQSRTHILANMFEGGIPYDWEGSSLDWINLTAEEKQLASPIYKQAEELKSLFNEFTRRSREKLLDRFNIVETVKGDKITYSLKNGDMTKFADMIRQELINRDYPENVVAGIEWLLNQEDGSKKVFDLLTNKNRIENLLFSLIGNNAIRQKYKGDMKVQVSSMGFETTVKTVKEKDSGIVMSGDALKFYRKSDPSERGSETLAMEVYMPHQFQEYFGTNMEIRKDGIYNERGEKIGDNSLLELIGFRIPTDGLHSIDFIKIKGFLPPGTDMIVVPSELATKAGSDYDIDKLTLYFPTYRLKGGKYIVKRKYINASTTTKEGLKEYYDEMYGPTLRLLEALDGRFVDEVISDDIDETTRMVTKMMTAIFGEEALNYSDEQIKVLVNRFGKVASNPRKDRADRIVDVLELFEEIKERAASFPTFEAFVQENKGKDPSELNHIGAIQNRIMEISKDILSSSDSYAELLNPIGISTLLEIRDRLKGSELKIPYSDLVSYPHIHSITKDFQAGKDALGIAAVAATHIVKSQQAGLFLKANSVISTWLGPLDEKAGKRQVSNLGFNFEGFSGRTGEAIDFSRVYDIDGRIKLTDLASEFVNVYADVSEDPIVADLNIVPEVANAMWAMIRAGVPIDKVISFLNQPIIKDYLTEVAVGKSKFLEASGAKRSAYQIIEQIHKKYSKAAKDNGEMSSNNLSREDKLFTSEALFDMEGKNMTALKNAQQILDQLQVLEDYIMYDAIGQQLSAVTNGSSFDTMEPNSRNEARLILKKFEDVQNLDLFGNLQNLINATHLKEFKLTHEAAASMFNMFFLTERAGPRAVGELDRIFDIFSDSQIMLDDRAKLNALREAENDLITAVLSTMKMGDKVLFDKIENLFLGDKTVAKRIEFLQRTMPDNPFIQGLMPVIASRRAGDLQETDNLKMYSRILNNYESNLLRDAFFELSPQDQNMIVEFAILQSGLSNNSMSILHLIPAELFAQKAVGIITKLDPNTTEVKNFFDNFFRNNWNNPSIVPRLPKSKLLQLDSMPFPLEQPSIRIGEPLAKFPYVAIITTAETYEQAKENRKNGIRNKTYVKLFRQEPTTNGNYHVYKEVKKLGNGTSLKEYPFEEDSINENNVSVLEKNNLTKDQTIQAHSIQTIKDWTVANVKLSEWALRGIRNKSSRIIAAPLNKQVSISGGIYLLPDGTKIRIVAQETVTKKDLEKRGELDTFARKQGFTGWDTLVASIGRGKKSNHIPKSFLSTKNPSKVVIYNIVQVDESQSMPLQTPLKDITTIAALSPETYDVQDAFKLGPTGGIGADFARKMLHEQIQKQLDKGKRTFAVNLLPGIGMMAAEILLEIQTAMINRNEQLNLVVGTPSKTYLDKLKGTKEGKVWYDRYVMINKRLNRRRSNNFRALSKMPTSTEQIKLNTKEIQELIKEESKTNCD